MVRDDHRLFFQDVSFEGNVPVMVVHLPFQFLSWRGNGAESREEMCIRDRKIPVNDGHSDNSKVPLAVSQLY